MSSAELRPISSEYGPEEAGEQISREPGGTPSARSARAGRAPLRVLGRVAIGVAIAMAVTHDPTDPGREVQGAVCVLQLLGDGAPAHASVEHGSQFCDALAGRIGPGFKAHRPADAVLRRQGLELVGTGGDAGALQQVDQLCGVRIAEL